MGSDTLRPTRAYPLKLTQASLRQTQGADDPAPVSLHAPFLQIPLLHQLCNQAAIIVIVPRQLPHQRHRHLSTQAHKLHQLHCHTSILQLHLNILHTYSQSSAPNRLTAANTKTIHKAAGASCPQPSIALRPSNRLPDCATCRLSKFLPTHSHPRPFLRQEVLAPQWVGGSTQRRKSARGFRPK